MGHSASVERLQGLAVRLAKAVNRQLGRHGRVWASRYHSRLLRTPREVRNALVYVLNNWRKHERAARGVDPLSSARFFDGWRNVVPVTIAGPVARARTWLVRVGWRWYGAIAIAEGPDRSARVSRRSARVCRVMPPMA